jgi:D-3-phosphoglycerate dehydrogenase
MDLLILDALDAEVMQWLESRHLVRFAPELALDSREFRQSLHDVRAVILPSRVAFNEKTLHYAPVLRAVGRVHSGAENIDLEACSRAGVEVVRSAAATALAEAEFMIGAGLSLLRRVPVAGLDGMLVGRELGACTVGLLGMSPSAKAMAGMLSGFGCRMVAYDPSLHASDGIWPRWQLEPVPLRELIETSDLLCVQLSYFTRYRRLLGERLLPTCKPQQVLVSVTHSGVFDEEVLAEVLRSGRMAAAWLDSLEPGATDEGKPLHGLPTLQVTPQVASTTRESRLRSAWAVARRIDDLLSMAPSAGRAVRPMARSDEPIGPSAAPASR